MRNYGPILMFLLPGFLMSCQQSAADQAKQQPPQNEGMIAGQQWEAISLDGRKLFPPQEPETSLQRKDSLLREARRRYEVDPGKPENIVWMGRRLAYLYRFKEAIDIYSRGLEQFPDNAELYRHRGHRYISTRQFDEAVADFEKAASLVAKRPLLIEPDGIPNRLNIPLSNLQFNIWYHWALAQYLQGNFTEAARLYEECLDFCNNPDLLCATTDWLYMTYRRLGETEKARTILEAIRPDLQIIENSSYFQRLLMYKGLVDPDELLDLNNDAPGAKLDIVTQGYGVGNWYLYNDQPDQALPIFQKILNTNQWSAFGYIAAEADLLRMTGK